MNELILYAVLGLLGLAVVYLILKVRQPVVIQKPRKKSEEPDVTESLGDIGEIIKEAQPEIVKMLKLNEEQQKTLNTWVSTLDKITHSKLLGWLIKKVM